MIILARKKKPSGYWFSVNFVWIKKFQNLVLKNLITVSLVNRFAMHHFRSGFSIVVTDVWTRSLLTPVHDFIIRLPLRCVCFSTVINDCYVQRAVAVGSSEERHLSHFCPPYTNWAAYRRMQRGTLRRSPHPLGRPFYTRFNIILSWLQKIKTNLTYICN